MDRKITRRDFVNGFSVATAAALPLWAQAQEFAPEQLPDYYPPARNRHARRPRGFFRGGPPIPRYEKRRPFQAHERDLRPETAPAGAGGTVGHILRHIRAEDSRSACPLHRGRGIRRGTRHCPDHREPLASPYAYTYNSLFEPMERVYTNSESRPNGIARQPYGLISIANSDAGASPHTDTAIWEAWRAVGDILNRRSMPFLA
jgi:hypothetical protein